MFIDTNVLVHVRFATAPEHHRARGLLDRALSAPEPTRISRQIVREYLAVVTRPQSWSNPLPMAEALQDVARITSAFETLEDSRRVQDVLMELCRDVPVAGRQVHDANIVATMVAHGERRLLTFNFADFRRYGDRIELVNVAPA